MSAPVPPADPEDHVALLPARLSPSRAKDYSTCPRKFYFTTIVKLPSPATVETTRGTLAHAALERLYQEPRSARVAEAAVSYVRPAWAELLAKDAASARPAYQGLVEAGSPQEERLLRDAEQFVRNYFTIEDPTRWDADAVEKHVSADIGALTVHGFIDRLDHIHGKLWVTDYKTGRMPRPRYQDEAFFAMKVYALLLREMTGIMPHQLRLLYLSGRGPGQILRADVTPAMLSRTRADLVGIWRRIQSSAARRDWPAEPGPLCGWCAFKPICPAFAPPPAPAAPDGQAPPHPTDPREPPG
ncbi:RecB family exonuclease [Bailinhaonella thermotolerans]|uniref:PD-(D/E)XK nuclease family protein n=1 Tax=Bailinhaonella thermotolerans TaxID=1070861 RepID=A0A3A4A5A1_9ACTN|nr:PD-(D/E)XK nuclease family protein [Bailinhaonella thermotolerans]RJL24016.1 PD-(D/E)XK nuclease family protein [Bailinhaonella thermotolerans]